MTRPARLLLLLCLSSWASPARIVAASPTAAPTAQADDGRKGFSFAHGRWLVHNRRLKEALSSRQEWLEFDAHLVCVPVLEGLGNVDELRRVDGTLLGSGIRVFDIASRTWSDYWISARQGGLQAPTRGTFSKDGGVFEGTDTYEGKAVRVRYTWSRIQSGRPRWEQAFSADGGRTWQVNWVMDFEPRPGPATLPWPGSFAESSALITTPSLEPDPDGRGPARRGIPRSERPRIGSGSPRARGGTP